MKKTLLMLATTVLVWGCAKKQVIKPQSMMIPPKENSTSREEPSSRYSDWDTIPQLKTAYFEYDKSNLLPATRETLQKNAEYLKENKDTLILVEGHCDERGTTAYNLALGQRRASAVREYYGLMGITLNRVATISYGSEKTIDQGHDESAWQKNRRAETKTRNTKVSQLPK